MTEDERIWAVKELLFGYVKSPSLRHIRDPHSVIKLAQEIVTQIDRGNSIWRKWDGRREVLLKSAKSCWIPIEDLRDFLNRLPGPSLTTIDVEQRLSVFVEEEHWNWPNEELQPGCLSVYEEEKVKRTEPHAIIGLLQDYIDREVQRIRIEREEKYRRQREQEQTVREQRLLSGAQAPYNFSAQPSTLAGGPSLQETFVRGAT